MRPPIRWKIAAYVAAWIGALVTTDPTFGYLPLIYMFPPGLFAFVPPEHRQVNGWFVMISAVLLYVVHAFFYFRARTTLMSAILYLVASPFRVADSACPPCAGLERWSSHLAITNFEGELYPTSDRHPTTDNRDSGDVVAAAVSGGRALE